MKFNYFDIHSHLNLPPLFELRAEILTRMREKEIGTITVGTDYETSKLAVKIADENPDICFATVGLHPTDNSSEIFDYEKYLELAKHPKVVAIGETGLDYHRNPISNVEFLISKNKQKELFEEHIKLAIEVGKPLMIHARPSKGSQDAYEDVLGILEAESKKQAAGSLSANFHFFVGDLAIAKRIVANGWTMSFDGPITFSRGYDAVIQNTPLENIMCETDAPFAAPVPYRGKTCEPSMVEEIYKKIAEIRGEDPEIVRETLLRNANRVFRIPLE